MNFRAVSSGVFGKKKWAGASGFTIVELLAATAIFGIILAVIFGVTQQISNAWKSSSSKIEAFQEAREVFSIITRQVGQATLNTYYDYFDAAGNSRSKWLKDNAGVANPTPFSPSKYGRFSDLNFVSGGWSSPSKALVPNQVTQAIFFQTPAGYATSSYQGMDNLLNACGYYIVYNDDSTRPAFLGDGTLPQSLPTRYRFRLMQFLQPSQQLMVYDPVQGEGRKWFANFLSTSPGSVLGENIIALVILPKRSAGDTAGGTMLAPDFEYDSRPDTANPSWPQKPTDNQLPPLVEIVMVAIDEASAKRLCTGSTMPDFGMSGGLDSLFKKPENLNDLPDGTPGDVSKLTRALDTLRVGYRVFRTQVALHSAKWSDE